MKIFVLSPNKDAVFSEAHLVELAAVGEVVYDVVPKSIQEVSGLTEGNEERVLALDPDFCGWSFTAEEIDSIPNLKAIVLQTTGFDWMDAPHAESRGIPVINLKGFSTEAVAEWALFMALALARKLPVVIQDGWQQDFIKHQGVELKGKKAGIIGLGAIGSRIAELAKGVGMDVLYWSKNARNEMYAFVELDDLLQSADVIFPAMAKNANSLALLSADAFSKVKPSAIVVTIMHDLAAHDLLLEKVKAGTLGGYAFEENAAFTKYDGNTFASPEIAWATDGSMQRNGEMWARAIMQAARKV